MRRREFLGATTAGMVTVAATALGGEDAPEDGVSRPKARVSHNGIVIHPYESELMKGSPPPPSQIVTQASYISSREHREWAHQHMSELCRTQPISRGLGDSIELRCRTQSVDKIKVSGADGKKTALIDLLKDSCTDAFLVLRNGKIVTEQYFTGMRPDTRHQLWSASKSISVGVLFNLIHDGLIEEEALVTDYIPVLLESGYKGATIRQLMDMQSGVQYDYQETDPNKSELDLAVTKKEGGRHFRAAGFCPKLRSETQSDGQYEFFKTLQMSDRKHGSIFYYKCCDTAVLGWACEKVTKTRLADLISQYIWSKLGAERDAYIVCDVQGGCSPNAGMSVTLRDLARWGQMHVSRGKWNGHQVIPKNCIRDIQTGHDPEKITPDSFLSSDDLLPDTAYRSQYWIPGVQRNAFYAGGAFGQYCYVHPKSETVIVRFASEGRDSDETNWNNIMTNAFAELTEAI